MRAGTRGNRGGGRPAKSMEQHIIDGTFRKDRHAKQVAKAKRMEEEAIPIPPPPADAKPDFKATWARLAETLGDQVYGKKDLDSFQTLVRLITESDRAYEHVTKHGQTTVLPNGTATTSAQMKNWMEMTGRLLHYFARFSMTPYDRMRNMKDGMKNGATKEEKPKPEDEFAAA